MSIFKAKNGKWHYQFMLNGERKHGLCIGCRDKKEALEFEGDLKYKLSLQQRGKIPKEYKLSFKKATEIYLKYSKANKITYKKDETLVKYMLDYFGKDKKVSEIKPIDIEKFKTYMTEVKKRSNATFNRYYSALSKMFNILIENDLILKNPCKKVKKLKEDNQKTRYLSKKEEKALFKELADHLKPIVICALQTGLRRSNILNMRWENIDLKLMFIEVLKQENKGHKKIQIPISPKLYQVFMDLVPKENGYVFINPETSEPYTDIHKGFDKAVERAGIKDFTFHDLRHTVGTRLMMKGMDVRTIQEMMAHSQISTTQRYMHVTPENKKKAIKILNSF